jgi:NitT/TauT family transport system ATP-binding protein
MTLIGERQVGPGIGDAARSDEVIRFEGVGKTFSTATGMLEAARDVNLVVRQGEFVTLVGPSGCGKSTLLNIAAGLYPPTQGSAFYAGQPVTPYNQRVGYMTQSDHLLPWRNVAGNIAVPLEINGTSRVEARARIDELIEFVGLGGFAKSYPSQLSGGMRKRTVLARLLAYDPETLLLDEPFAALDAQLRLRLQIEIRHIARKLKKTILFVTHDLDEAVALADRCAIFTARPGTIKNIIDIPLPADRDLLRLRHDRAYMRVTAELWDEMAPAIIGKPEI